MAEVSRDAVMAALGSLHGSRLLGGSVVGVEPRDEHVLVRLDVPWLGGSVAVEADWPDDRLTGTATGEPAHDLREWVTEVAIWLAEEIDTADVRYVRRRHDPIAGYTIVEFAPYVNPDFVREILDLAGLDAGLVCVPPHRTAAPVGLVVEPRGWRVYSADLEPAEYESEPYAWGDLFDRIRRRWPDEIAVAVDRWNGER